MGIIKVTVYLLEKEKAITQWYPLQPMKKQQKVKSEIQISLIYVVEQDTTSVQIDEDAVNKASPDEVLAQVSKVKDNILDRIKNYEKENGTLKEDNDKAWARVREVSKDLAEKESKLLVADSDKDRAISQVAIENKKLTLKVEQLEKELEQLAQLKKIRDKELEDIKKSNFIIKKPFKEEQPAKGTTKSTTTGTVQSIPAQK